MNFIQMMLGAFALLFGFIGFNYFPFPMNITPFIIMCVGAGAAFSGMFNKENGLWNE